MEINEHFQLAAIKVGFVPGFTVKSTVSNKQFIKMASAGKSPWRCMQTTFQIIKIEFNAASSFNWR